MTIQPQPEALRLADALLEPVVLDKHAMQAAAELRRLHAECEALRMERDALRAAANNGGWMGYFDDAARAAKEQSKGAEQVSTTESTEETVEVYVQVEERVSYARLVTMPRSKFDAYESRLDSGDASVDEEISSLYIRYDRDWLDSTDTEVSEFRVEEQSNG